VNGVTLTACGRAVVGQPRRLGLVGKAIVARIVLATATLVVGGAVAISMRRAKERRTVERLEGLRDALAPVTEDETHHNRALHDRLETNILRELREGKFLDAWGNPIQLRSPGPVHAIGFDLISPGPNGVFEEGRGDDLVAGLDLRNGTASVTSDTK